MHSPTPTTALEKAKVKDWTAVAKLAGKHGIRYRTNKALEEFLTEITAALEGQDTPRPIPSVQSVDALAETERVQPCWQTEGDTSATARPDPGMVERAILSDQANILREIAQRRRLHGPSQEAADLEMIARTVDGFAALSIAQPKADTGMVERLQNTERNKTINRASTDLQGIIFDHDPEVHNLNNRVWDRLDKMACEIAVLSIAHPAEPTPVQGEPVAWLYERKGFRPSVSMRVPDYKDIVKLTPLYASPSIGHDTEGEGA